MKKTLAFAVLMILSSVAPAQSSTHQKVANTTYRNPASDQTSSNGNANNAANGMPGTLQKAGNTIPGAGQQRNTTPSQSVGNSTPTNHGNGNRKVCRTIGSTVYYCL